MRRDGAGERDLEALLRSLSPRLQDGEWVFVTAQAAPPGVVPLATFVETEGTSLVVTREQADAAGLSYDFVGTWISLTARSALDAVGLTAAVAGKLAAAGVSCNVIVAFHHDHLFVAHGQAQYALVLLEQLADRSSAP